MVYINHFNGTTYSKLFTKMKFNRETAAAKWKQKKKTFISEITSACKRALLIMTLSVFVAIVVVVSTFIDINAYPLIFFVALVTLTNKSKFLIFAESILWTFWIAIWI